NRCRQIGPSIRLFIFLFPERLQAAKNCCGCGMDSAIKPCFPIRRFVAHPLQKIGNSIAPDVANGIDSFLVSAKEPEFFPAGFVGQVEVSSITLHPITQLLPPILRLPIPSGSPNQGHSKHCKCNPDQNDTLLAHGTNNMPSLALEASRKRRAKGCLQE